MTWAPSEDALEEPHVPLGEDGKPDLCGRRFPGGTDLAGDLPTSRCVLRCLIFLDDVAQRHGAASWSIRREKRTSRPLIHFCDPWWSGPSSTSRHTSPQLLSNPRMAQVHLGEAHRRANPGLCTLIVQSFAARIGGEQPGSHPLPLVAFLEPLV